MEIHNFLEGLYSIISYGISYLYMHFANSYGNPPLLQKIVIFVFTLSLLILVDSCKISRNDGSIQMALETAVESLDPVLSVDEASGTVLSLAFRRMYQAQPDGSIRADLVDKVHLRKSSVRVIIKGSDYSSISGDDVFFCLQRLKKSQRQTWLLENIDTISKVNHEIVFNFKNRAMENASLKNLWSKQKLYFTLPATSIYSKKSFLKNNKFQSDANFSIISRNQNQILLQYKRQNQLRLSLKVMPNETGRWFFFKKGLLDIYVAKGVFRFLPFDKQRYHEIHVPQLVVLYAAIVFQSSKNSSILRDVKFRRAINTGLDRKNLTEKTLLKAYKEADYPVPPELYRILKPYFTYKKEENKFQSNELITVYSPPDSERQSTARAIAAVIRNLGIKSRVQVYDFATIKKMNFEQRPGLYVFKWVADYAHAENFLIPLFHSKNKNHSSNRAHFADLEVDYYLDRIQQNRNNIELAQNKIREKAPWVFIGFARQKYYIRKGLQFTAPLTYTAMSSAAFE